MSYFKETVIDKGTVIEKRNVTIVFQADEDIPKIKYMESTCGCTVPRFNELDNTVTVTYSPKPIPQHLINTTGFATATQGVTIHYKDGTADKLSFKVKIVRV
jgi:hypothetical protein